MTHHVDPTTAVLNKVSLADCREKYAKLSADFLALQAELAAERSKNRETYAALVAKLKAEAVREYVESLGAGNFTHQCVRCLKPYNPVGDSEDCPFCGCTDEEAKAIYDNAGCIERGEV